MAERRMFAKTIVLSDAFLDLPMSARCLYFTLGMLADDDGFVNAPRSIMRQCGATDTDMKLLLAAKFVLIFESGVIVIKHWRINNYLRSDRYTETKYAEEKAELSVDDNGTYHKEPGIPDGIPGDYQQYTGGIPDGIPRIGKVSTGKVSGEKASTKQDNTSSFSSKEEEIRGEYEGGDGAQETEGTQKPKAPAAGLRSEKERANRILYLRERIASFRRVGFDPAPFYKLAAQEGISKDELEQQEET